MPHTQRDVTRFYDSLVYPSRSGASAYSQLATDLIKPGWRVGDFGCGQSLFYSTWRDMSPTPVFLDVSINALKTIGYGFRLQADLSLLPLRASIFDAIFCIGVIHHLPDIDAALRELGRVIVKNGVIVIGVYSPSSFGAWLKKLHDFLPSGLCRKAVFETAVLLLWIKLNVRFWLSWQDARKRVADLLQTPVVNYLRPDHYKDVAAEAGLRLIEQRRLSGMNILHFQK